MLPRRVPLRRRSLTRSPASAQAVFTVLPVRFAGAAAAAARCTLGRRPGPGAARPRAGGLAADQLFDVLCVLIFGATFAVLRRLPAGAIYFWLKDLTQEFLKLHVVHSAVEIFDKARPAPRGRPAREARARVCPEEHACVASRSAAAAGAPAGDRTAALWVWKPRVWTEGAARCARCARRSLARLLLTVWRRSRAAAPSS